MDKTREPAADAGAQEPKQTYRKPAVQVEPPATQPEVLGGQSHVGCDVDANCPGQDEAG